MVKKGRLERKVVPIDPEADPTGARGMARAELQRKIEGYSPVTGLKKPIKEIIKMSPKVVGASSNVNSLVKTDLENLQNAGYDIKEGYKRMKSTDLWNYYMSVLVKNDYFKQD
jgi:hypothetical protein